MVAMNWCPALSRVDSCQDNSLARVDSLWRILYIGTPQWRRPISRCNFSQTALQLTSFYQVKMTTSAANSMTPSSPISIASTPIPVRQSLRADERRIESTLWRRVGHQSLYRNCKRSSVWSYSDMYVEANKPRSSPHFICDYCNSILKSQSN